MADDLFITDRLTIPAWELSVETTRSGGPGGQHVNTTDTAVRLRWAFEASGAVHPSVKDRIRNAHGSRITQDGELLITSQRSRSQIDNLDDVRAKLAELIRGCLTPPKPRRPTRPTLGSQKRRVQGKKQRGKIKAGRGRVTGDD